MDFFLKIYKNRPAAGASAYNTIELGHSAQQMWPFCSTNEAIFKQKNFNLWFKPLLGKILLACLLLPLHAQIFFGVTMRILSNTQVTIVSRFFSLSSYHLARIYSCATASLLSKKLVRRETPVRHTSLLVTA